jgi:hypothetical protein
MGFFIDFTLLGALWALGLTQPPTEMSTRDISWGVKAAGAQADNLTIFMLQLSCKSASLDRPVIE